MKYFVTNSSNKTYEIEIEEISQETFKVTCEGESHEVFLSEIIRKKLYSLILDQQSYEVKCDSRDSDVNISLDNFPFRFTVVDEVQKRLEKMGGGKAKKKLPNKIKAEMPGVVVRVVANLGDHVSKGDVLLVVEAMKMQNEITALADARVEKILVNDGDVLGAGDTMLQLKYD